MRNFEQILAAELDQLDRHQARRACPQLSGGSRVRVHLDAHPAVSFASNDYLGLASDPRLAAAAAETAQREGYGASAARLVSGDLPAHRDLEANLATFLGRPAALVFPSGYQANLGVVTALAGPDDLIVSDALNHASLIDGCRLSRAQIAVYPHGNASAAAAALASAPGARRRLLVTESLFSMDGDAAPIVDLASVAHDTDAILVVDEAHAIGVHGPAGRGLCAAAGVVPDVLVGTLGKSLAAGGGFVAGSSVLREYLVNRARTFIFTTALPAPVAAAAARALEVAAGPEGDQRRTRLADLGRLLAGRLAALGSWPLRPPTPNLAAAIGPIFPFLLGENERALRVSAELRRRSIFVPAIRPPTVPAGTSRLRITLSAAHERDDVLRLTDALAELAP